MQNINYNRDLDEALLSAGDFKEGEAENTYFIYNELINAKIINLNSKYTKVELTILLQKIFKDCDLFDYPMHKGREFLGDSQQCVSDKVVPQVKGHVITSS